MNAVGYRRASLKLPLPGLTVAALCLVGVACSQELGTSETSTGPGTDASTQVLINAYYLQEEATRDVRRGEERSAIVDEVFDEAVAMGVSLVRTNGHNDDVDKAGDSAIQTAPGEFDEVALEGLDLVLFEAAERRLELVLVLGNHWDAYGGTRQYVSWAGFDDAVQGDGRFYSEPAVRELYRDYITMLLSRENTRDGIAYAEHPAIYAFEILNEPRGTELDREGETMRAWVDDIAGHIKSLSPDKRVSTGEEGFDDGMRGYSKGFWQWQNGASWMFRGGSSFRKNIASPHVDLGSVHLYPKAWGWRCEDAAEAGKKWIEDHADIARAEGKELLVGEFGLRNADGCFDALEDRRSAYASWLTLGKREDVAAVGPWLFAHDSRPEEWDAYSFYWRDGTPAEDPSNSYVDLLQSAAAN